MRINGTRFAGSDSFDYLCADIVWRIILIIGMYGETARACTRCGNRSVRHADKWTWTRTENRYIIIIIIIVVVVIIIIIIIIVTYRIGEDRGRRTTGDESKSVSGEGKVEE